MPTITASATNRLTRKQERYRNKYGSVSPELLTRTIKDSWTRPIPAPLNRKTQAIGSLLLLLLIGSIIGALLGTPDMSGLYFLFTQTNPHIKAAWDGSLPDGLRHAIRDDGIGLMGGLWAVFICRNRYKPLKPLTRFDRWEMNFHIGPLRLPISNVKDEVPFSKGQFLANLILVPIYGSFGFVTGELIIFMVNHVGFIHDGLDHLFGWLLPVLKTHTNAHGAAMIDRIQASLVDKWPGKLTGLLMAFFFGRRPAKGTMDDMQLWLAQQAYSRNLQANHPKRPAPWYYPPNWRATYNDVMAQGPAALPAHSPRAVLMVRLMVGASTALAVYGWYVLLFKAHK